jgi:hypothetical protein
VLELVNLNNFGINKNVTLWFFCLGSYLEDKKDLLISGLKQVLPDTNNKVTHLISA